MNSITSQIYNKGKLISSNIVSLDIYSAVNKITYMQLVVSEGGEDNLNAVELSNADCFKPGEELEIDLSYQKDGAKVKGVIVKQNIKRRNNRTLLTIDLKDSSYKLTLKRTSKLFENKNDFEIITDIAKLSDVGVECNEETCLHKQIIQYYSTDWDFIISRAEANGLLTCVENGVLNLRKPSLKAANTNLTDIYEYEIETDISNQFNEYEASCWDIKNKELTKYKNSNQTTIESAHNINQISSKINTDKNDMLSVVNSEEEEMKAWANAAEQRSRFSLLKGRFTTKGNPLLKLGDTIQITGLGEMFNAKTVVSAIRHRISSEGWLTDIQCGLTKDWFYTKNDIVDKPASGLLPGINGLQVGIVEAYPSDGDPDKLNRIKVKIPAIDETESVIWARLLFPYAGDERGMFLVPEEGDEVVVGFFNDDPRHAVVIGSLYNGTTSPPLEFTDQNIEKGFISRNGIRIIFSDEDDKEKIEMSTPGGNEILLEDENGISITDKNSNKITFDDTGVVFEDKHGNNITTDSNGTILEDTNSNTFKCTNKGIEIKDLNGNSIKLSSAGIEIKDMSSNKIELKAGEVKVQSNGSVNLKGASIGLN